MRLTEIYVCPGVKNKRQKARRSVVCLLEFEGGIVCTSLAIVAIASGQVYLKVQIAKVVISV